MTTVSVPAPAEVLDTAHGLLPGLLDLTEAIARVPAPTGDEGERARYVAGVMAGAGGDREVHGPDDIGNVWTTVGDTEITPAVVLAAHTDTVFAAGTELDIHRDATRLHGAGIGDNSLGVAAMLTLPALFGRLGVAPAGPVVLAATVGEEGLGNLAGIRAIMDRFASARNMVAIEGHNLGRVTYAAVGSRRIEVVVTGPGGHSWGNYGQSSAIHVLGELIASLSAIRIVTRPKTTLNIGMIDGGISINTIAPRASMLIDMRSLDAGTLDDLTRQVLTRLTSDAPGVTVKTRVLGERPAGQVDPEAPIIRTARRVLAEFGREAILDASSTDANIAISRGIPAICIGLTTGGNVHRPDEWVDTDQIPVGLSQLALLTLRLAAAGNAGCRS
ncbi:MAG: M20/M25/M40 family metallo-hydrolase [Chloroflexia bacterium]|nr:M20/M25/M40 family metallo-hydrolase [Chloroflexia bacterium]